MGEAKFLSNWVGLESVPESYVFPPDMRASVVVKKSIPIVDFANLDRALLVQKILDASQDFGFFQMINHGVSKSLLEETMRISKEFHDMSAEEKMRECSKHPNINHSGNDHKMNDKIHFWRDFVSFNCYPLEKHVHLWPENPPKYRELVGAYCDAMSKLSMKILEMILIEGLGMGREYLKDEMIEDTKILSNHYPPCPNPSLTLGLKKHCDPSLITILFQDVNGLQFLKDGEWIAVDPIDGALLVNIGYALQVITNGKLIAGEHQAVTNKETTRQSIVYLVYPKSDLIIEPAKCLISEVNPPRYRSLEYGEVRRGIYALDWNNEAMTHFLSSNYQP